MKDKIIKNIPSVLLSGLICILLAMISIKVINVVKENEVLKTEIVGYELLLENVEDVLEVYVDTYEEIINIYKAQTKTLEQKLDLANRKIEELNIRLQYQDKSEVYELLDKLLDDLSVEDTEALFWLLLDTNPILMSGYIEWVNR